MKYVALFTGSLFALACQPTSLRTPELDGQTRELQRLPSVRTPEPAPTLVQPRSIGPASTWRFDPRSEDRVAASDEQGCGVWQRTGEYLGAAPAETCATWDRPVSIDWQIERLRLGYDEDHIFELRLEGNRFELEGTSLTGRTKAGRYRTATFGPDGGIALAVMRKHGSPIVEVWNDEGRREWVLELDLGEDFDPDAIIGLWLGWSLDAVHALVETSGAEEGERRIHAFAWPDMAKAPIVREFVGRYDDDDLWLSPDRDVVFIGVAVALDSLTDLPLQPLVGAPDDAEAQRSSATKSR